ncbi:hypothetical protein [Halorarius halobius]|uniref:hypothetical protein n=1 Tax=Halorarius halobius TaxID=2962671 RepID=UPI0020CF51C2|nr:hypothetical protein [Halorarius halobius]
MLLQSGPRFAVPFALTGGFGLLLALAGAVLLARSSGADRNTARHQAFAVALALFGLGFVALAFDFAGSMASLMAAGTSGAAMEPTLAGRVGLALPWEPVALGLFALAAAAAIVGVRAVVRGVGD